MHDQNTSQKFIIMADNTWSNKNKDNIAVVIVSIKNIKTFLYTATSII